MCGKFHRPAAPLEAAFPTVEGETNYNKPPGRHGPFDYLSVSLLRIARGVDKLPLRLIQRDKAGPSRAPLVTSSLKVA